MGSAIKEPLRRFGPAMNVDVLRQPGPDTQLTVVERKLDGLTRVRDSAIRLNMPFVALVMQTQIDRMTGKK